MENKSYFHPQQEVQLLIEWMSKHMQLLKFKKLEEAYPIDRKIQ